MELWGHRPLFLFLFGWLSLFTFSSKQLFSTSEELRWVGLSTASGVLLSIGFPPLPLTPIMFIGLVPLFWLWKEIQEKNPEKKRRLLFKLGYNTFAIWNILATYWVANTAFVAGIFAIFVNALFMCVPLLLANWAMQKMPRLKWIPFIAFWLSFEYLHLRWEITWPWLTLGNSFAQFPSWVQWYEITGAFGGSLWILGLNVLIFSVLWNRNTKEGYKARTDWIRIAALVVLPIAISLVRYFTIDPNQSLSG